MSSRFGTFFNVFNGGFLTPNSSYTEVETPELFKGKKVVPWYTTKNDFGILLTMLLELSSTHRSCVNTKADYILGDGFSLFKGKGKSILNNVLSKVSEDKPSDDEVKAIDDFLEHVNVDEENINDILKAAAVNYEAYGNVYIETVRGSIAGQKYFYIYLQDAPRVLHVKDEDEVMICSDFNNDVLKDAQVRTVGKWSKDEFGGERRVWCLKAKSPLRDTYGLPPAVASMYNQKIEHEIPSHNLDRFYSDFMPKIFMQFFEPGGMTEQEEEKFYNDLEATYTRRGGKKRSIFAQVLESENMKANIQMLGENTAEGDFQILDDRTTQKILTAHQWHHVLAGIPSAKGIGDSKEVRNVFELYNNTTIKPRQNLLLSKLINPIFKEACEWLDIAKDTYLGLSSSLPISFIGDIDVNAILTVDEAREYMGWSKLPDPEKGGQFVKRGGSSNSNNPNDPNSAGTNNNTGGN